MTTQRIHILPPLLANQIAAGEVVERPASVIKELLENSLDAGAHKIDIDIENGGIDLIRLRDDGAGIEKEDLPLALSRHATSKIVTQEDLQQIASLGFRGEALASIAAVSRLSLTSRTPSAEHAWRIISDPSTQLLQTEAAAHPQGTTIEMRDLFYNLPARRKFLKSERTELGHIETMVQQIVLSRHDFQLTLRHQQKTLLQVKAATDINQVSKRIAAVCGSPFINQALHIEFTDGTLQLQGWLGLPAAARSQTDNQYFFVNGRIVRDKLLNHAVKFAYQSLLPEGRHPAYVLYLTLPHDAVDVNVHPTKHEVRFYESRHVHDFVAFHLQRALQQDETNTHAIRFIEETPVTENLFTQEPVRPHTSFSSKAHFNTERHNAPAVSWPQMAVREAVATYETTHQTTSDIANKVLAAIPFDNSSLCTTVESIKQTPANKTLETFIGILQPTELGNIYILLQHPDGLMIIDALQAAQAIAYHKLCTITQQQPLTSQPLLLPPSIQLPQVAEEKLEQLLAHLANYGIKMSRMADTRWLVRELPTLLKTINIENVVKTLLCDDTAWQHTETCLLLAKNLQLSADVDEKKARHIAQELCEITKVISPLLFNPYRILAWKTLAL